MIDLDNCDFITSIKCIGAVDETIYPRFFILEVNILYKLYTHNALGKKTLIGTIDRRYANYDTPLEWPQHFNDNTKMKRRRT